MRNILNNLPRGWGIIPVTLAVYALVALSGVSP